MENNVRINKIWIILKIMFFCMIAFSFFCGVHLTNNVNQLSEKQELQYIENWTVIDSEGNHFKTGRSYKDERAYSEDFTLITKLPENIESNQLLCFQNRSDVKVFINGELRKSFDRISDTGIPGGSLKEFYMTIPVNQFDAGAELKIVRSKTEWNPTLVFETFLTTSEGFNTYMTSRYGLSFTMAVVLLIASLLVIVVALIIQVLNHQRINMLYAALGIFNVACWLISVSQFTPFVFDLYYVDGFMGFFSV